MAPVRYMLHLCLFSLCYLVYVEPNTGGQTDQNRMTTKKQLNQVGVADNILGFDGVSLQVSGDCGVQAQSTEHLIQCISIPTSKMVIVRALPNIPLDDLSKANDAAVTVAN